MVGWGGWEMAEGIENAGEIVYRDRKALLQMNRVLMSWQLDNYTQYWVSYLKGNLLALGAVYFFFKLRFTRVIPEMSGFSCRNSCTARPQNNWTLRDTNITYDCWSNCPTGVQKDM